MASCAVALSFAVERLSGDDWRVEDIRIDVDSAADTTLTLQIRLGQVLLPQGYGQLRALRLGCALTPGVAGGWSCTDGVLQLEDSPWSVQHASWQGHFLGPDEWQMQLNGLSLGKGRLNLTVSSLNGEVRARLDSRRMPVGRLIGSLPAIPAAAGLSVDAQLNGSVSVRSDDLGLVAGSADLRVEQLTYAEPTGRQAAEQLTVHASAAFRRAGSGWRFNGAANAPTGAFYSEPLFIDAAANPLGLTVEGAWQQNGSVLVLDAWTATIADTLALSGTGRLRGDSLALDELTVVARSDNAGRLYSSVLQPFLIGSPADDLAISGRLGTVLHLDGQGVEQLGIELNALTLVDRAGRYALNDVTGSLAWDRSQAVPLSRLDIASASIYRIPSGAFSVRAQFAAESVRLTEPVVIPLLGGRLAVDSFELEGALVAGKAPSWQADVSLSNVSLRQLTEALVWPPFNGEVNAELKNMRYADRRFRIGGGLALRAFNGRLDVRNLVIQDPLGVAPVLEAEADFRGLSLESLTETFSFGLIEGRLDGDVRNLRLVGWQPDRFDLHFSTPPNDTSRRRISQRAVENLTELGSGVPAGLSTTFLSMFDQFGYSAIDLRVSLLGDRAELDGLAREGGGFYLVKGAGLPRIDVIGRNRSVAWKDLIERLRQIQVEGARIE